MTSSPTSFTSSELRKSRPHRFDPALQGHRLTVAYRGTDFSGWQRQAGKRTVHPSLYDRMIAAGVTPDYPRPAPPSRFRGDSSKKEEPASSE